LRLLALDRPGIGGSDYHSGRTLVDWPPLLAEVADLLKVDKFRILAISGGGPYALSAAWGLPERVIATAVCCGAPPIADREDVSDLLPVYRFLLRVYRRHPSVIQHSFRLIRPLATLRPPAWLFRLMVKTLPAADAAVLAEPGTLEMKWEGYAGAWRGDRDGVFGDARIYAQPWGFRPEDIRVPVRLWHGKDDANFRWPLAADLAARIPACTARFLEGEGHYSLAFRRCGEILRYLVTIPG
jgi:pimeloyl-ACP methyl ester carboxylesterase